MNDLTTLTATGRLGEDPKIIKGKYGDFVGLSIACTRDYKDKDGNKKKNTVWLNCTASGKLGEIIVEWFKKGNRIAIEAKPYNNNLETGKGKNKKTYTMTSFRIENILNFTDNR